MQNNLKVFLIVIIFIVVIFTLYSQERDIFNKAIDEYKNGNYSASLSMFKELYREGYDNFEINFNLGCNYFKIGEIGMSRYHFERALVFKPFDDELYRNLIFIYDLIPTVGKTKGEQDIFQKRFAHFISMPILLALLTIFLLFLSLSIFFFFISEKHKKLFSLISIVIFIFVFFISILFFIKYSDYKEKFFIVTEKICPVFIAPDENSNILIELEEGVKGKVSEKYDNYLKVQLKGGVTGWLEKKNVILNK